MERFKISDESINSYNIIVRTNGINLPSEPISLLFNHNYDEIIGKATNFTKEGVDVYADAEFDQDEDSLKLKAKVDNGSLTKCSIGIEILKANRMPDDVIEVTECNILELSLTPVPANKNAKKVNNGCKPKKSELSFDSNIKMYFSGKPIELNEIDNLILNMTNKEVTTKEVVEPIVEPIAKVIEVTPKVKEEVVTPAKEVIEEVLPVVELSTSISELDALKAKLDEVMAELQLYKDKEVALAKEAELSAKNDYLQLAVADGKISESTVLSLSNLDLNIIKSIVDTIPAKKVSLSQELKGKDIVKDYNYYTKSENAKERAELIKSNFSLYKQLESDFLKSNK